MSDPASSSSTFTCTTNSIFVYRDSVRPGEVPSLWPDIDPAAYPLAGNPPCPMCGQISVRSWGEPSKGVECVYCPRCEATYERRVP